MYCSKCGAQNENNAINCINCGQPLQNVTVLPAAALKIPNYLVQAILVTLCCCLPFGIVSIVYAAQVNGKIQAGDIQGAMETSGKAKMWCWIGFGTGLVANLIIAAIQILGIIASQQAQ